MAHHCHATDCEAHVPPEMLMCLRHWRMVPKKLQMQVWNTYRNGQCDDWNPSSDYCRAAKEAVTVVATKENKIADVKLYDLFDPENGK